MAIPGRFEWLVLILLASLLSMSGQVHAAGLVAAYSFDEGSGTTLGDSSGYSNTGTIANGSWTASGKFGSALTFNGTSTMVTIADANSLDLTNGMTIEAWVYPTSSTATWRTVVLKEIPGDLSYGLYASEDVQRPSGWVRIGVTTSSAAGSAALALNTWSHLATTYNGSTLRLYVNGTQVATQSVSGTLQTSASPLRIGGNVVWGEYFVGRIDEVRIYNRALSAAEIASDVSTPVGGSGDTQAPTTPTNFTATAASSSQINLSWTASTDNVGVTGYLVERCQGSGCSSFSQIATPTGTTYSDTGLTASTTYRYRVRARDAVPNYSSYSSIAAATTQSGADTQAPTTPTNFTATVASSSQINLSWTASTDNVAVTGYLVERCQGASCSNFGQIATPTGTTFNDTGLTASTVYRYRVRARDAVPNYSSYSSIATATTQAAGDTTPPTAPSGLTATPQFGGQNSLTWNASTDNVAVTGYSVERCAGTSCSNFVEIATPTGTSYLDTGLVPTTNYRYRVRARDAVPNWSGYSNVSGATPADCD